MGGPWRCLPGCLTHRDGSTDDGPSECYASERVGITRLSGHPLGVALEVLVDQFAERGVTENVTVVVAVQPQQRGEDGLLVLTVREAERHIATLQAAVTAARASDPHETPPTTAGGGE